MEKAASASASAMERDLEEWEFLSDDGFVDLARPDTGKGGALLSRARGPGFGVPKGLLDVNYFVCPPPHLLLLPPGSPGSELADDKDPDAGFAGGIKVAPRVMLANQEVISQVFFRKLGESEFADMKMDSPPRSPTSRGVKPLAEAIAGPVVEYEEKGGVSPHEEEEEEVVESEIEGGRGFWESFGFSIWRWRIKGVGALCSIGVAAAAATICIFVLSGRQRQKHQQQNQKLQFQIYHDDQSFKQVVQQAARLNHAISVVRGVPATRAHVSFGGYYDGL
uniref:Vacuolar protein sorting-associated protein 26 n=1 Tax=Anthurium amnicola TaxID=1678845 RepID=A0A1D1YMG3_9ARAE